MTLSGVGRWAPDSLNTEDQRMTDTTAPIVVAKISVKDTHKNRAETVTVTAFA